MANTDFDADFLVVGAGLAGLEVATELRNHEASVIVLEARDRVGGRVLTGTEGEGTDLGSHPVDLGAQWIGPGQSRVMGLVHQLGLRTVPCRKKGKSIWILAGHRREGLLPFRPNELGAVVSLIRAGRDLMSMVRTVPTRTPWEAPQAGTWDGQSVEDWMGNRVHDKKAKALFRVMTTTNMACEPSESSLLGLLFEGKTVGSLSNLMRAESFRIVEGAQAVAVRLAERLGDVVSLGTEASAVTQDLHGVTVTTTSGTVRARRVCLAVPPVLASEIAFEPALPEATTAALADAPMGSCIKFHALYPEPFWRRRGLNGTAFSADDVVSLTYDNSPSGIDSPGSLVGFVVADSARSLTLSTPEERDNAIRQSLGGIFGSEAASPVALVVKDWATERFSRGAYAAHCPPGYLTRVRAASHTPVGRVHWAGTETSWSWRGYMEGALASGARAAEEMRLLE